MAKGTAAARARRRASSSSPSSETACDSSSYRASSQPIEGRAGSQRGSEVVREATDVRPFAAQNAKLDLTALAPQDFERTDLDEARLSLDLDPLARELVQALPLLLDRRNHGRNLLDASDEAAGQVPHRIRVDRADRFLIDHLSRSVPRVGRDAEAHDDDASFGEIHQVGEHLGSPPDTAEEHAGREGIETPGVSHLLDAEDAPKAVHGVVAGPILFLVDRKNEAVHSSSVSSGWGACSPVRPSSLQEALDLEAVCD